MGGLHGRVIDRASTIDASSAPAVGGHLAQLHFTRQAERISELEEVEVAALDPFLRVLLFTDGTVTRTLEAQTLSPVKVELLDEANVALPETAARLLDVQAASLCVRRRVRMSVAQHKEAVWAESYLIAERLPAGFIAELGGASHGIGGSLTKPGLESSRELLHFGLTAAPLWASKGSHGGAALSRLYRISTGGLPALFITETFAVQIRDGLYSFLASPA